MYAVDRKQNNSMTIYGHFVKKRNLYLQWGHSRMFLHMLVFLSISLKENMLKKKKKHPYVLLCSPLRDNHVFQTSEQRAAEHDYGCGRTRLRRGAGMGFRRPVSSLGGKPWSPPQNRGGCWRLPAASWGGHHRTRRQSWKKEKSIF